MRGSLALEDWSELPKLAKRMYANLCVQKSCQVRRKHTLYQDPHNTSASFFNALDTENYVSSTALDVPPYPEVGKVVAINSCLKLYVVLHVCRFDRTYFQWD